MADFNKSMAKEFDSTKQYLLNELTMYEDNLYRCRNQNYTPQSFSLVNFEPVYLVDLLGLGNIIDENIAPEYNSGSTYSEGEYVLYNRKLYICKMSVAEPEKFDSSKWSPCFITDLLQGEVHVLNDKIFNLIAYGAPPSTSGSNTTVADGSYTVENDTDIVAYIGVEGTNSSYLSYTIKNETQGVEADVSDLSSNPIQKLLILKGCKKGDVITYKVLNKYTANNTVTVWFSMFANVDIDVSGKIFGYATSAQENATSLNSSPTAVNGFETEGNDLVVKYGGSYDVYASGYTRNFDQLVYVNDELTLTINGQAGHSTITLEAGDKVHQQAVNISAVPLTTSLLLVRQ